MFSGNIEPYTLDDRYVEKNNASSNYSKNMFVHFLLTHIMNYVHSEKSLKFGLNK